MSLCCTLCLMLGVVVSHTIQDFEWLPTLKDVTAKSTHAFVHYSSSQYDLNFFFLSPVVCCCIGRVLGFFTRHRHPAVEGSFT